MFGANKDHYCFICGNAIALRMKIFDLRTNKNLKTLFNEYFGLTFTGDLWFAPDYCCNTCARTLYGWAKRQPWKRFSFKIQATDEHGERFHQVLKPLERRYAGKNRINMLADFANFSVRESPNVSSIRRPHFAKE